jgi:hypothetical protein
MSADVVDSMFIFSDLRSPTVEASTDITEKISQLCMITRSCDKRLRAPVACYGKPVRQTGDRIEIGAQCNGHLPFAGDLEAQLKDT